MAVPKEEFYTADEFFEMTDLPIMSQLINGKVVCMTGVSNIIHHDVKGGIFIEIMDYIKKNKGKCRVFIAPFDVKLDDHNVVEPDILVTCDPDKLDGKRHNGAPDWIVEVVSPGNRSMDYYTKLKLYLNTGVKEYWIVDPEKEHVMVHIWDSDDADVQCYSFKENIPVYIYRNTDEKLSINISEIMLDS